MAFCSNKMGFTLVESMVVVAVITLLMAVMLPVLGNARENGRVAVCANNQRQLGVANQSFANENRGRFVVAPVAGNSTHSFSSNGLWAYNGNSAFDYVLYGRLYTQYLSSTPQVYYCPSTSIKVPIQASLANLGVPNQSAVSSYFQRGVLQGAPLSTNGVVHDPNGGSIFTPMHDTKTFRVLLTDIHYWKSIVPNHPGMVVSLINDFSVKRIQVPLTFRSDAPYPLGDAGRTGGDSSPGANDGSWSQLDSMINP